MKFAIFQRPYLSPFITAAFAVLAITGVLLFFHVKNGVIVTLHEWFGWAFIAAGIAHLFLNLKLLLPCLTSRQGRSALIAALCLAFILGLIGLNHKGGPHRRGGHTQDSVTISQDNQGSRAYENGHSRFRTH